MSAINNLERMKAQTMWRVNDYEGRGMLESTRSRPWDQVWEDNWESTFFTIFWQSWNWPWYNYECWLYWLHWHLAVEPSSLTLKNPQYESQYCQLWMWRESGFWHWSGMTVPTDYENSPASGSIIPNSFIARHSSQHGTNGPSSSTAC